MRFVTTSTLALCVFALTATNDSPLVRREADWPFNILNKKINARLEKIWPRFRQIKEEQRERALARQRDETTRWLIFPAVTYYSLRRGIAVPAEAIQYMRTDKGALFRLHSIVAEEQWLEFVKQANRCRGVWDKRLSKNPEFKRRG